MNELFIKRMKELLKDDFDAFINSLNEKEVKGFYLNPLKKDVLNYLNHQYIEKHPYVDGGYYFDYLHYPLFYVWTLLYSRTKCYERSSLFRY